VEEGEDIIVNPVFRTKVEVQTVSEDLGNSIVDEMFRNKHNKSTLVGSPTREVEVGLLVVGQENLTQKW
jgi:hypothetical protein